MLLINSVIESVLFIDEGKHGRLQLIINKNLLDNSKYGIVENVFVSKSHRKQGIAKNLIKESIKYAKNKGLYKIILNCGDENIDLYHKYGFKIYQYNMRNFLK